MANPAPSRKRLGTDRLLADVYGATFQRRLVGEAQLLDSYIGQLRFDTLFAKTVVVPDAHLLDGVFFLSIEPDALVRAIGRGLRARTMPIEWRCRSTAPPGSRVADSLRSLLFRSDSEHLNTYAFNAIGDSALRVHLAEELGRVSARTLEREFATTRDAAEIPARLAGFLRRVAGATPDLDMMEQGWRRWIEAERSGLLSTAVWNRPFDLARALKTDRPLNPRRLRTAEARRFFQRVDEVLAYSRHRSDMTMLFEQARSHFGWRTDVEQNPDDLEARDLRTIDNWYSQGRYLAAARQHGADISFVTDPHSAPLDRAETRSRKLDLGGGKVDVVMADEILPGLALLDDDEFAKFTRMQRGASPPSGATAARQLCATSCASWRAASTVPCLRRRRASAGSGA